MGVSSFMVTWSLLMTAALFAVAFITWVLAVKENGWLKLVGQAIAVVIVILTLLVLIVGGYYGAKVRDHRMMGSGMMMKGEMQNNMMKDGKMMKGAASCMDKGGAKGMMPKGKAAPKK